MVEAVYLIGLSAVGKTTATQQWQKSGGAVLPEFGRSKPDYVRYVWHEDLEGRKKSQEWTFNEMKNKDGLLRSMGNKTDGLILVDRCILDVWAYSMALGVEVGRMTAEDIAHTSWVPGKVILMFADEEIRKKRWIAGKGEPEIEWQGHWKPLADKLEPFYTYLKDKMSLPSLDTSALSIKQMTESVRQLSEKTQSINIEGVFAQLRRGKEKF